MLRRFNKHAFTLKSSKQKIQNGVSYQDIFQLQVSVNDLLTMYVHQTITYLFCPSANIFRDIRIS